MENKTKSGFTLIEVMVVLAVIAILSTIAIPNFSSWRTNMYVKAAARDIYSSMQEARLLAVKENSSTAIVFDTTNSRYYLCDNWGVDEDWAGDNDNTGTGDNNIIQTYYLNKQVRYGHANATSPVTVTGTFDADNISYTTPDNVLNINSRGIGADGYVYIENQDSNRTYAVGTQTSGLISILKWDGGSWQ